MVAARPAGFTLIELITVMVLLSVMLAIGGQLIVTATASYNRVESRGKLQQQGRLAIERITRQLRLALPNAVRVSASGNCIEFMPVVAGARYLQPVPDTANAAPAVTRVATAPFTAAAGAAHMAIAPLAASEVYTAAAPAARAGLAALGPMPIDSVALASAHRFVRNSVSRRLFLLADPARFCATGGRLRYYSDYGLLAAAPDDTDPGGSESLLSRGVTAAPAAAFVLSAATPDRNATVDIHLRFAGGGESIVVNHTVFIRNVP